MDLIPLPTTSMFWQACHAAVWRVRILPLAWIFREDNGLVLNEVPANDLFQQVRSPPRIVGVVRRVGAVRIVLGKPLEVGVAIQGHGAVIEDQSLRRKLSTKC